MYISITKSGNNKNIYIVRSYRKKSGKTSSSIIKKLGTYNELLAEFSGDENKMMEWAKNEAKKETLNYINKEEKSISINLSQTKIITKDKEQLFNVGYLFLQKICTELHLDNICRNITSKGNYDYDLHAILTDLIYARILNPSSKFSSYKYCHSLLEPPKYNLHSVYRALSVIANKSDYIQSELYRNSNFIHKRNNRILYYDCTNYYFEIEEEESIKKYGKSKENRPNPIVSMGLFMDADGIPLAFDIFPGNQNEQTTLKPLESKIIHDFDLTKFIYCSDSGLGSKNNRIFNNFNNRSYIITHSLKKLKKEDKAIALSPLYFKKIGSNKYIDISKLDESEESVFNSIYYKEVPLTSGNLDETLIVSYSPKYKAYQRKIRQKQIDRALKMINSPHIRKQKNQNDPSRFINRIPVTSEGEIANRYINEIDEEKIQEEAIYDGFYAVVTNLDGDINEILNISKQRWQIEENFRIMKTEFEARPVFLQRTDRIKAHFLTCFISLLVYRLLEKKLDNKYTCKTILDTLKKMNVTLLEKNSVYIPSYTRTNLTDDLHNLFDIRTDYEVITKASMRNIIKQTKQRENKKI